MEFADLMRCVCIWPRTSAGLLLSLAEVEAAQNMGQRHCIRMQFNLARLRSCTALALHERRRRAMTVDQFVQTMLGGLAIGCIYSLIALGISMIIRATDILHFAQGEMLMIGSMTGLSAFWLHDMPFGFVLLAGILGGGLVSMLIELVVYRTLRPRRVALINVDDRDARRIDRPAERGASGLGFRAAALSHAVRVEGLALRRLHRIAAAALDRHAQRADHGGADPLLPLHAAWHRYAGGGPGS